MWELEGNMKDFTEMKELLVKHVEHLEEEDVLKLADQLLDEGIFPRRYVSQKM